MSTYMTEEEQIEIIKKWWKKYSNVIIIVLCVILLFALGFKYLQRHNNKINEQASNTYENLMIAVTNNNEQGIISYANSLIKNNKNSVYADAARLALAKIFVEEKKYALAREYLANVTNTKPLKQVARIRLARIYLMENSFNEALKALEEVFYQAYIPLINETKGDIYAKMKHYPEALAAYKEAINNEQLKRLNNSFLQMKYNNLEAIVNSTDI